MRSSIRPIRIWGDKDGSSFQDSLLCDYRHRSGSRGRLDNLLARPLAEDGGRVRASRCDNRHSLLAIPRVKETRSVFLGLNFRHTNP